MDIEYSDRSCCIRYAAFPASLISLSFFVSSVSISILSVSEEESEEVEGASLMNCVYYD